MLRSSISVSSPSSLSSPILVSPLARIEFVFGWVGYDQFFPTIAIGDISQPTRVHLSRPDQSRGLATGALRTAPTARAHRAIRASTRTCPSAAASVTIPEPWVPRLYVINDIAHFENVDVLANPARPQDPQGRATHPLRSCALMSRIRMGSGTSVMHPLPARTVVFRPRANVRSIKPFARRFAARTTSRSSPNPQPECRAVRTDDQTPRRQGSTALAFPIPGFRQDQDVLALSVDPMHGSDTPVTSASGARPAGPTTPDPRLFREPSSAPKKPSRRKRARMARSSCVAAVSPTETHKLRCPDRALPPLVGVLLALEIFERIGHPYEPRAVGLRTRGTQRARDPKS